MHYLLRRRKLGNGSCKGIVAASKTGIQVIRNDKALPNNGNDYVFRWGCTSTVPNGKVVNDAKAIHLASNKREFRRLLQAKELCPDTWFNRNEIQVPCVIRPPYHHQGRKLYFCRTQAEVDAAIRTLGGDFYASEFIDKVAEYRVFVCQGRAVWVAKKSPNANGGVAWNVAQGGTFENVRWDEWPLKVVKTSIEAYNLSGLDFGGVDTMVDAQGNVYVLEINAAPSQTSPYRQQCTAKAFDYIVRNGKEKIGLIEERGGYRKFIHPALAENAILPTIRPNAPRG